jgi:hypothetical protein
VTGLLRCRYYIAPLLVAFLVTTARRQVCADRPPLLALPGMAAETRDEATPGAEIAIEQGADGATPLPPSPPQPPRRFEEQPNDFDGGPSDGAEPMTESDSFFAKLRWLGFRHSLSDGRNAGMGIPLTGTSWLNRPFYFGGNIGTVWLTRPINDDLTTDVDTFGGIFGGWDWDYYWGTELAINRATPEIINERARDAPRGDRMMEETISLMYYPWGDSLFRPYWRFGIGATEIDYPTDHYPTNPGFRRDETLWTFPIGIGLKYPLRRWLAARIEFADQLALGNDGVATQHDLTLTFGLEWRFGAHPRSYWPWNPSRHIW